MIHLDELTGAGAGERANREEDRRAPAHRFASSGHAASPLRSQRASAIPMSSGMPIPTVAKTR